MYSLFWGTLGEILEGVSQKRLVRFSLFVIARFGGRLGFGARDFRICLGFGDCIDLGWGGEWKLG